MRKYAKALHQVAIKNNKLDVIFYQFDEFMEVVKNKRQWIEMMDSPMLSKQEKEAFVDALNYDITFNSFIKVLSKKHLLKYINELHYQFVHLVRETQKIAHLHLYLVKDLTEKQEAQLLTVLKPRFKNQTISLHKTIDPNLIGGIKITHHGQSLDRSIARELEELFITI